MDEIAPASSDVSSVGRPLARLTLWSPFLGIILMGVAGSFLGEENVSGSTALYGISSLYFAGGLALGIAALQRTKVEGRQGIWGRTDLGMCLNGVLLGVTLLTTCLGIHVGHLKATPKQEEAVASPTYEEKLDAINASFAARLKDLQNRYQSASAALTNPPILELSAVRDQEELKSREKKVGDFIAGCNEMLAMAEHPSDMFQEELMKQSLAPEIQARIMNDFTQKISAGHAQEIVPLRQAELHMAQALLTTVTFLDSSWGQWKYVPASKKISSKTEPIWRITKASSRNITRQGMKCSN